LWSNLTHLIKLCSCNWNVTLKMAGLPVETCTWKYHNKDTSLEFGVFSFLPWNALYCFPYIYQLSLVASYIAFALHFLTARLFPPSNSPSSTRSRSWYVSINLSASSFPWPFNSTYSQAKLKSDGCVMATKLFFFQLNAVAYPGILFRVGRFKYSVEDRGQRERGSGGR